MNECNRAEEGRWNAELGDDFVSAILAQVGVGFDKIELVEEYRLGRPGEPRQRAIGGAATRGRWLIDMVLAVPRLST
jgi:hypothetical protein